MKKIVFAVGIFFATASVTFGQDNDINSTAEVSPFLESQFMTDFPHASDAHFISEKNFDKVSFTQDKEKMSAYYDGTNRLVGTIEKKVFDDLPDNAKKEILKNYSDYTVADVIKFNDNESESVEIIMYGTSLDDEDNYFLELKKDNKAILLKVDLSGHVEFLTTMK
jgi:hypothetical protein